jgi:hypothetical protein
VQKRDACTQRAEFSSKSDGIRAFPRSFTLFKQVFQQQIFVFNTPPQRKMAQLHGFSTFHKAIVENLVECVEK